MKKLLLTVLLSVVATNAFGHDISSEYFYQAKKGETFVEGNLLYRSLTISQNIPFTGEVDTDLNDLGFKAHVEYGFNETYSGYFSTGYFSGETESPGNTTDFKGLEMLNFGLKYSRYEEKSRYIGRANIGYGLEKRDDENRTGNELVVNLAVGYEYHLNDTGSLGALLSYAVVATDTKTENGGGEIANKGNVDLTTYYEHMVDQTVIGGKLAYTKGGINYFQGFYQEDFDFDIVTIGAYGRIPMSETMYLVAAADYRMSVGEPEGIDSFGGFEISAGARLLF